MKFRILDQSVFRFPFQTKRLAVFAVVVLFVIGLPVFCAASDDVQQIEEDTRQLIKQADKLARKGNTEEAEKILRRIIGREPNHSTAKLKLAYLLLKRKNLLEAYNLSFDIAKNEPRNSYAFAVLGMTLLDGGRFDEAERVLITALKLNKKESLAWAGIGMLDFYENRISDSIGNLRTAVYLDSEEPDFTFALAQVSARAELYKDAAEAYDRFLQISPQTDKERRDRIKGLINFLNYLGGKRALYVVGGERSDVSFELVRDRPIIKLRVNKNKEPLRFVLDTGSGISVVSKETAAKLNIKAITRGGLARAVGGNGKFEIVYGFLNMVEIGDVQIENVPVYIREFHNNDEKIDGYIGLSLISKFLTTIDYGKQTFSLTRKDIADQQKTIENQSLYLPLRLTSSGFLSGEVQLEGVESSLNFIVDTGASISVISSEVAGTSQISRFIRNEKLNVVGAAGVTENVSTFMLPKVTFGSNSRKSIMAIALDLDIINEASGFQQAGILGGNFLKNYRLTFDFKNSKVIFTPVEK